jgi:hypothetical protein
MAHTIPPCHLFLVVEHEVESHSQALCKISGVWLADIIERAMDQVDFFLFSCLNSLHFRKAKRAVIMSIQCGHF